ncbi:hypothetical protein BDR06DRAFT_966776 [Suillus hirtellus]|nr:hypothetical protein BDR06DRAFT_966776 [Suillus hirtellus]
MPPKKMPLAEVFADTVAASSFSKQSMMNLRMVRSRKAKPGAIMSRILCAGPGEADVKNMVPHVTTATHSSANMCSKEEFLCPICTRTGKKKDSPLPYMYAGFGRQKKVKMKWPMCLINLNVESSEEDYLATTTKLFICTLPITQGIHTSKFKNLADGIELIHKAIKAGCPPNSFVIINTDSDEVTKGNAVVSDIVAKSLGEEFLEYMGVASSVAKSDATVNITATRKKPWCDLTVKARQGWRVLLLVGSHPTIRFPHHFESLMALVKNEKFDFVLGFGGSGSSISQISHTVCSLIVETGVFRQTDPWSALRNILTSNHQVLDHTTVVVLYTTTANGSQQVKHCQIGKDTPASHAFAYEFKMCGKAGCDPGLKGIQVYNQKEKVHVGCTLCHWKSAWARNDEDNELFKRVNALTVPQIFWHHFPPSNDFQQFFVKLKQYEPEGTSGKKEWRREMQDSNISASGRCTNAGLCLRTFA